MPNRSTPVYPFLLLALCAHPALAQDLPEKPAAAAPASSYKMEVRLDPVRRTLRGTQEIHWRNTSSRATGELRLHLYVNAFRDRASTFMREAGGAFRDQWRKAGGLDEFGSIRLDSIELVTDSGAKPLRTDDYISPDDGNEADRTVLRVTLPAPVAAGTGSVHLRTEFSVRLPKAYRRTGWAPGDVFFCMHWFPKLGVLEDAGWNCHQFHANSEFFADFSTYDVEITTPAGYVVGATGTRQGDPKGGGKDPNQVHVFHQDRVHDFAFVASARHRVHSDDYEPLPAREDPVAVAVAKRMGVDIASFDAKEKIRIILMLLPEHDTDTQRARHMTAVKTAINFFGRRYGPYPYETITVVDPCRDFSRERGGLGGGMEYPNLITCGTSLFVHPRRLRPEGVTVHEFGHQYWYGMSANNEFEEAWLDEGLNTYSETRAQVLHYVIGAANRGEPTPVQTSDYGLVTLAGVGRPTEESGVPWQKLMRTLPNDVRELLNRADRLVPALPLIALMRDQPGASLCREASFDDTFNDRRRFLLVDTPDPMVLHGWKYLNRASYGVNSYQRPATVLHAVERLVGRDRWWHFMRVFHTQSRFRHPTTADFLTLLGQMCGDDVARFFRGSVGANAVLDYGIESVTQEDGRPAEVVVRRFGTVRATVTIRFKFAGRAQPEMRELAFDDPDPWRRFTFDRDPSGKAYGELVEVWVDPPPDPGQVEVQAAPAGIYINDVDLLNNAWRKEADHRPALYRGVRHMLQVQSRLSHTFFIG